MDKICFVTGASRGIGKAVAERLLTDGYKVCVGYCRFERGAKELEKKFENAKSCQIDISSRKSIRQAIDICRQGFGADIDILVNNGAIAQEKPFNEISDEDWDSMLAINLRGPFIFSQEVISSMQKKKWGRIINIVSIGGQWGGINQVHYAAAKAGLINLTRSLAKIYSSQGITTNAVSPGLVRTDMSARELESEAGREKVRNIPIGRLATADEVAQVVAFLASDAASYVTGQTINVNGGMFFG